MNKKSTPELKIEFSEQDNIYFSVIEYKRQSYLCIIDNITPSEVSAYVLDFIEQQNIPVDSFLSTVTRWFYESSELHPLSVELTKLGVKAKMSTIYRTFDISFISRIVGQAFLYQSGSDTSNKIRRRRVALANEYTNIKLSPK